MAWLFESSQVEGDGERFGRKGQGWTQVSEGTRPVEMSGTACGGAKAPDDHDLDSARTALNQENERLRLLERVRRALESGDADVRTVLDPQEQKVLRLRSGVEDDEHYSLGAIGMELGMDADGVGDIEKAALRKLKEGGLLEND